MITGERQVWILNVGDSRGYRMHNGTLEQITQDHSLVEEQVRMGRMNPSEAERSPLRNVITRALGTQSQVTADVFALCARLVNAANKAGGHDNITCLLVKAG